jgi:hypothetical protein
MTHAGFELETTALADFLVLVFILYKRDINSYRRTYLIFLQNSELSTGFSPNRLVYWSTVELHSRGAWFQPLLEHRLYSPHFLQVIAGVVRR